MSTLTRYRVPLGLCVILLTLLLSSFTGNSSITVTSSVSTESPQGEVCPVEPQMAPVPYRVETRAIKSGRHTVNAEGDRTVFSTLVQSLDAPWLQVRFGDTNLGQKSVLRLTALSNGATQELDAETLAAWHNQSAMFKGDSIKIELVAAPEDKDVFFEMTAVIVGEWAGGVPLRSSRPTVEQWEPPAAGQLDVTGFNPNMVCGVDDRVASNDQAVGRIVPVGCTGWVISNGAFLTAGHCNPGAMTTIQFNVPPSNADGTINPPHPNDQYPIDVASIMLINNGSGDDWAVFRVNRNNNTRLTPPLAYGAFYRVQPQEQPATVRVTGYGVDGPQPCFGERRQGGCDIPAPTPVPLNADSQTQQTATAAGLGRSGTIFFHDVDITGGDSGGPVLQPDDPIAVAIHTHGTFDAACTNGHNTGTAFTNTGLVNAINNFPGSAVRYVDAGYPAWTTEDGTVFRPFNLVAEGINSVTAGGIVSLVTGHYNEPMAINKNVILEAPVGTVVIGAP